MPKAAFLDFDGTLVDSRPRIHRLFCELAGGDPLGFEGFWELKRAGASQRQLLREHWAIDGEAAEGFRRRWLQQIEDEDRLREDRPFEGADELLAGLAERGPVHIVTGRQSAEKARRQAASFGWDRYLAGVRATGLSEPKAALIAAVAATTPGSVMVGDSGEDIDAGRAAGLGTVAVAYGFSGRDRLLGHGPDLVVDSIRQVAPAVIQRWGI